MKQDLGRIETGSRVAVIGGGPAGCFFSLFLMKYARELGKRPQITIYEPRDFYQPGHQGCKGCAGILSVSLLHNLTELGLSLPEEVIQNRIERYTVHSPYTSITFSNPETGTQIFSVYRGSGPRLSHGVSPIGFDGWLLNVAEQQVSAVEKDRVTSIFLGQEAEIEVSGKRLSYDLIVLASGVNAIPIKVNGLEYIPPKTQLMAQDELYAGAEEVESRLGSAAHAFLIPHSKL
ncbi:MAG TPA: hypothetical protein VF318_04295, partial [Dehalococcoidales bacterium]